MNPFRSMPFPGAGGQYVVQEGALVDESAPPAAAAAPTAAEAPLIERIAAAIRQLDRADASLWTMKGKPRVEAIERLLDQAITFSERDAAWASVQPAVNQE